MSNVSGVSVSPESKCSTQIVSGDVR
jgi:hypothetical protein